MNIKRDRVKLSKVLKYREHKKYALTYFLSYELRMLILKN